MSHIQLVLLLSAAGAALVSHDAAASSINNMVQTHYDDYTLQKAVKHHPSAGGKRTSLKRFVRITVRPSPTLTLGGEEGPPGGGELICEALGSPSPVIRWYRNDMPVSEPGQHWEPASSPRSRTLARVVSTLLVPPPPPPSTPSALATPGSLVTPDKYSCRAVAGRHVAVADTLVYTDPEYTSVLSARYEHRRVSARVVSHHAVLLASAGGRAVLRCRGEGRPRPDVTWRDHRGDVINNTQRVKVLRSGSLVFVSVRWEDMGRYECRVANRHGAAAAETFLYPAAPSK